jgi:pimeloyl-ACP methyl ester carboxylesterase
LIEKLDEKIELLWILPGKENLDVMMLVELSKQRAWRRPANSSNIIFKSAGHLVPQESPEELAQVMADFLHRKYNISSEKSKL